MNRCRKMVLWLPLLFIFASSGSALADAGNATIYEIQQGVYSSFTFVTCDSIVVMGVGPTGFFVAEQGGGPYNGMYVNYGAAPFVVREDLITLSGWYYEDSGNTIINATAASGGIITVTSQGNALPPATALTVGDINTGSPTAEQWEGCLVTLDSVTSVSSPGGGVWLAIEIDGDAPGETLIVDTLLYDGAEPALGDTVVSLTGLMFYGSSEFKLDVRDQYDVLVADNIAPSDISDLAAATGTYGGEVDLSWTAPGDDADSGYAFSYTVRYDSSPINSGNWATASDIAGEPVPDTAGTAQSMVVKNLIPGQLYYFAIRAQDEFGNITGVSNSPSATASTNPEFSYQVVFGNLHSHTALSDGIGTLTQAWTYARDTANIDVLSITDHSHYLTTAEYNSVLSNANAFTQNGVFVALAGQEMGIANSSGYGHMSVWNASQVAPSSAFTNMSNAYGFYATEGVPGGFNHPEPMNGGSNFDNLAYVFQYDNYVNTLEVRNGKRSSSYESRYLQALTNGWHIGAVANQDNHNGEWGDQQNWSSGGDIYLTGMLVDSLATDAVLDALFNRRVYATEINPISDRVNMLFKANAGTSGTIWMGEIDTVATTALNFEVEATASSNFQLIQIYKNASLYYSEATAITNDLTWTFSDTVGQGETNFYHIRLRQTDQDYTWSSPIWLTADTTISTGVAGGGQIPKPLELDQNRPNPFNPMTTIAFSTPSRGRTALEIYDVSGRLVRTLVDGTLDAGRHERLWDGTDDAGREIGSGLYFYRVTFGEESKSRKMILVR